MANFVVWKNVRVPHACNLTDFNVQNTFPLRWGEPLAESFPPDAALAMHPDDPYDTLLVDSLANTELLVIGSQRLAELFRSRAVPCVEYLPVTVFDHKGRPTKPAYFILHPVQPVDCLDLERCGPAYSEILNYVIDRVSRLVIDEARIPADRVFFRCRGFYRAILVRRDFAAAISAAGMTGVRWLELEDFQS